MSMPPNATASVVVLLTFGFGAILRWISSRLRSGRPAKIPVSGEKSVINQKAVRRWIGLSLVGWGFVLVAPVLLDESYARGLLDHWPLLFGLIAGTAVIGFLWRMRVEELYGHVTVARDRKRAPDE